MRILMVDASNGEAARDAMAERIDDDTIAVVNKTDLDSLLPPPPWLGVSLETGAGTASLLDRVTEMVAARLDVGSAPALTRERHRVAVVDAVDAIVRARQGLAQGLPLELPAEDLRLAARALGRVVGRVDVENLLDVIFAEFCLGK